MKKSFFAVAAVCLLAVSAQAQDARFSVQRRARSNSANFVKPAPSVEGVVPRAARQGNVFQLINPFAPTEYGNSQNAVRREDSDPYQHAQGVRLVTVDF